MELARRSNGDAQDKRTSERRPSDRASSGSFTAVHPQVEAPFAMQPQNMTVLELPERSGISEIPRDCRETAGQDTKCHPPDDVYIGECYRRILALEGTGSRHEIIAGINRIFSDMAKTAETENRSYTSMIDSLLMLHWTRREGDSTSYDKHMQAHVDAISVLIRAMMKNKPIGKKFRIFDASCGTGKVLEATLDSLSKKSLRKVRIVANDVSAAAIEETRRTLAKFGPKLKVEYTRHDLTQELPQGRFDLIILSQTLALICDEKALRDKRLGREVPYESRHNTAKRKLLENLFGKVKVDQGEFWLIDEDPMRLSELPEHFQGIVEETLFREIFTECPKTTLVNEVMKRINAARFRAHAECYIDRRHAMYLITSTAVRSHDIGNEGSDLSCGLETIPPSGILEIKQPANATKEQFDEERYVKKIIGRMQMIHPEIAARLQTFEGPTGTVFKSIQEGEKKLVINKQFYEENIRNKPGFWRTNGHYNLVVISGLAHELGQEDYRCLIEKLHRSKKIGPGSAVLFVDTFPAPPGSEKPMGNMDARTLVFSQDNHVFCGSVRYGHKYGYLYVVKDI